MFESLVLDVKEEEPPVLLFTIRPIRAWVSCGGLVCFALVALIALLIRVPDHPYVPWVVSIPMFAGAVVGLWRFGAVSRTRMDRSAVAVVRSGICGKDTVLACRASEIVGVSMASVNTDEIGDGRQLFRIELHVMPTRLEEYDEDDHTRSQLGRYREGGGAGSDGVDLDDDSENNEDDDDDCDESGGAQQQQGGRRRRREEEDVEIEARMFEEEQMAAAMQASLSAIPGGGGGGGVNSSISNKIGAMPTIVDMREIELAEMEDGVHLRNNNNSINSSNFSSIGGASRGGPHPPPPPPPPPITGSVLPGETRAAVLAELQAALRADDGGAALAEQRRKVAARRKREEDQRRIRRIQMRARNSEGRRQMLYHQSGSSGGSNRGGRRGRGVRNRGEEEDVAALRQQEVVVPLSLYWMRGLDRHLKVLVKMRAFLRLPETSAVDDDEVLEMRGFGL